MTLRTENFAPEVFTSAQREANREETQMVVFCDPKDGDWGFVRVQHWEGAAAEGLQFVCLVAPFYGTGGAK